MIESLMGSLTYHAKVDLIGVPADPSASISLSIMTTLATALTITGIIEGDSVPDDFIPELVALYKAGKFPIDKLVTTFPFSK